MLTSTPWLPPPAAFRDDLRAAASAATTPERLERLARLSQHRLAFLETLQLDRAFGSIGPEAIQGFTRRKLALLASATVDHLPPAIRVAGLRRRLLFDVHVDAFGQYRQTLLDRTSWLHRERPELVLLSLTAREVLAGMPVGATASEVAERLDRVVADLRALWQIAREALGATVLQQTFLNVAEPLFGGYDRQVPGAPSRVVADLNQRLAAVAAADQAVLVDVARASEQEGLDQWFDAGRWLQGKLEIAPQAATGYGELVARVVAALQGLSKKCLVLDLDNTLWGGVVGDDGVDGIVLGEGSSVGEAHLALQRYAKQLSERGVILAVCSKNDPDIAEAAFRTHPEMVLRRSDIAVFVANWDDKAANLTRIAAQLNIGLDSLVFVDDNPVERARIRESLPVVSVPELPTDVAQYVRCLASAGYFESVSFTRDDRQRREQYAENAAREEWQAASQSLDEFLDGLKMTVIAGPFERVDLARITQLIGKTNQFNLTTRRHSAQEVARFGDDPACVTLQFRLVDRFGDNGLVSAMILRPDSQSPDALEIDTWIMSCRVFGRQLELEAMNLAVEAVRGRGIRVLWGDYLPTAKNGVVADVYARLGFTKAPEAAAGHPGVRWTIALNDYVPQPTHIRRSQTHDRTADSTDLHTHSA